uniref:Putative secreted protein n=1 Tax=Ixodes ricinus TaxID=34613 RepID=A0A147BEN4_IXORI
MKQHGTYYHLVSGLFRCLIILSVGFQLERLGPCSKIDSGRVPKLTQSCSRVSVFTSVFENLPASSFALCYHVTQPAEVAQICLGKISNAA